MENAIILNNDANIYEMQFISFSKRKKKKKKKKLASSLSMTIFPLKPLIFSSICTKSYLRFACYRSEHLNSTYINLLASLI